MKKNLFYLFALICSMSLFTACSDDDEAPDYSKVIESEMAGNYKGTLTVTVEGTTMPSEPQKIKIEKAGPSAINLSLANFSFMGITIGDVELKNCVLSQNGNVYTFTGTQDLKVDALSCTINAKGTIANSAVKVDMDIDATVGGLKQSVKVVYEGTRLTGSESSEAKITAFSFDMSNEANAIVIEQPVINEDNTITFRVNEEEVEKNADALKNLVPTFTISDKATSSVESGKAMNLSSDVTIAVTAEDGKVVEYVVKSPTKNAVMKFTFDEWEELQSDFGAYPAPKSKNNVLATSNPGAAMLHFFNQLTEWPALEDVQGVSGSAAKLVTLDTRKTIAAMMGAAGITSGSLFTGRFAFGERSTTIEYTKFGVLYPKKPLFFKGVYKFTPGHPFIETHKKSGFPQYEFIETDAIDECAIQAVLYTITSEDETLDGTNIDSDDERIVARARLEDGTAKDDWTPFNLEFKWKEGAAYDATKTYKLAIVCSSSKDGANFNGAANSTLIVDELEVIGE